MTIPVRITFRKAAHTEALLDGRVMLPRLEMKFTSVDPISEAFRRAIRNEEFEISEMALVTLAMAHDAGKPWKGLPLVVARNFHQGALRTQTYSPIRKPEDLIGRKVGVRAYSQTTGVWVRGILSEEYGVDYQKLHWCTNEDAHVEGYADPGYCERLPRGTNLGIMLGAGELDAVIGDGKSAFGETRSVISEPEQAAAAWYRKTGIYPVNHVIAIRSDLVSNYPWMAEELRTAFQRAKEMGNVPEDLMPYGEKANRKPIDKCLEYAAQQGLTRTRYKYNDLFV